MFSAKKTLQRVTDSFRQKSDEYIEIARGLPPDSIPRAIAFSKAAILKDVAVIIGKEAGEESQEIIDAQSSESKNA